MFTTNQREGLLARLVARARADPDVTGAALVGSAARDQTDRWSDIDLALRLRDGADPAAVAEAWGRYLSAEQPVADHLDLWSGSALYRVFLLTDSLQVDLSFWPGADFASTGEPFRVLFGEANPDLVGGGTDPREVVGWAWLHALHARSAIARGRRWQALSMLDGLRERVITLACLRHGLPADQGRGADQLPAPLLADLAETLVDRPGGDQLATALGRSVGLLLVEVEQLDAALAAVLRPPLTELTGSARPDPTG